MSNYLITGSQGSGKTTVIKQLQKLGYTAYNTDDLPDVTKLQDIETGETIEWPDGKVDWSRYAWNWQEKEIMKLLRNDDTVFIGAVVSNQEKFYDLFDKVFIIIVGPETLRRRLLSHEHKSHHLPGFIEKMILNHEKRQNEYIKNGAIPVSGEGTPSEIANSILSKI
jgi:broad-specificity NMP kinase